MPTNDIQQVLRQTARTLSKNSPAILTAFSVAGLWTTFYLLYKAAPKAALTLEYEKDFRREEKLPEMTALEAIQLAGPILAPSIVMGLTTTGCMIASNHISARRNAALVSLFTVTETALREYQAKVVDTIGEKKEELIRGAIAEDTLKAHPVQQNAIILTGRGNYLCFDNFSKRYFTSDLDKINAYVNEFNRRLNLDGWLNINYFYDLLGLDPIELGDEYGWIAERALMEIKVSSKMAGDPLQPCAVIDYMVKPYHI